MFSVFIENCFLFLFSNIYFCFFLLLILENKSSYQIRASFHMLAVHLIGLFLISLVKHNQIFFNKNRKDLEILF